MRKLRTGAALLLAAGLALAPAVAAHAAPSATLTDSTTDVADPTVDITSFALTIPTTVTRTSTVTGSVTLASATPAASDPSWTSTTAPRSVSLGVIPNDYTNGTAFAFIYTGTGAGVYIVDATSNKPEGAQICSATATGIGTTTVSFSALSSCFYNIARAKAFAVASFGNNTDYAQQAGSAGTINTANVSVPGGGYLLGEDGGVFTVGDAPFYGSTGSLTLNQPVVALAKNPKPNSGYWFVASDGGVFTYGPSTAFYGSRGGQALNAPIVAMAPTPSGNGYYLVASDGGIFTYGDATFKGSTGGQKLNQPIVGISVTAAGYTLVASDGGVFNFGTTFYGSTGNIKLNQPIVGIGSTSAGYYLAAADGGVFTYGNASFEGSAVDEVSTDVGENVVSFNVDGNGYHFVTNFGYVYTKGTHNYGDIDSTPVEELNAPVVGGVFGASL